MNIVSPVFENEMQIPQKYTCDGQSISPPLSFSDIPQGTKSLALIMDDPDAPNGTFVHWVLYNIDPKITDITENSIPQSALEGKSSLGKLGYVAACPPSGMHRYFFKLYALDVVLGLNNPDKLELEERMRGHIIEEAQLIGLYNSF